MARCREETISDRQAEFLQGLGVPAAELPESLGDACQLISSILFVRACTRKRLGSSKCISKADAIRIARTLVDEDRNDLEHLEEAPFRGEDGKVRLKNVPAEESELAPRVYEAIAMCEVFAPPVGSSASLSTGQWRMVVVLLFVIICGLLYILMLSGCASVPGPITGTKYNLSTWNTGRLSWGYYQEHRRAFVAAHPELAEETCQAILEARVLPGMDKPAVRAAWGNLEGISYFVRHETEGEFWLFPRAVGYQYVQFGQDGRVVQAGDGSTPPRPALTSRR